MGVLVFLIVLACALLVALIVFTVQKTMEKEGRLIGPKTIIWGALVALMILIIILIPNAEVRQFAVFSLVFLVGGAIGWLIYRFISGLF